jgi:hypothetical protein
MHSEYTALSDGPNREGYFPQLTPDGSGSVFRNVVYIKGTKGNEEHNIYICNTHDVTFFSSKTEGNKEFYYLGYNAEKSAEVNWRSG